MVPILHHSEALSPGSADHRNENSNVKVEDNFQLNKTFASLFKNNRMPMDEAKLHYIPHNGGEIVLDFEDIYTVEKAFGYCLIGCVLGNNLNSYNLKRIVQGWGPNVKFRTHQNGWITFLFPDEDTRDQVLRGGPYIVYGRQLYLKPRPSCFLFREEDKFFVPSWIQLHGLPSDCWTTKTLSKLSSVIGKPIYTDQVTRARRNERFARVLVEIDASKNRIRNLPITLPTGSKVEIKFVYEGEPKYCENCGLLGHFEGNCKKNFSIKGKEKLVDEDLDNLYESFSVEEGELDKARSLSPKGSKKKFKARGKSKKHNNTAHVKSPEPPNAFDIPPGNSGERNVIGDVALSSKGPAFQA